MSYESKSEVGFFISDGYELSYRISHPAQEETGKTPAVLLLHGASTPKGRGRVLFEVFQKHLAQTGFSSMAFDTRGVGESQGEYFDSTLQNRLRDAEAAYQKFIQDSLIDVGRMSLLGVSMGGHIAANLAGSHPEWFQYVILANPAAYGSDAEDKRLQPYIDFTEVIRREGSWENSPSFCSLSRFARKVLLFRSEFDQVVPPEVTASYLQAADGHVTKIVIPGIPHIFLSGTDDASEIARQFVYGETVKFLNSGVGKNL